MMKQLLLLGSRASYGRLKMENNDRLSLGRDAKVAKLLASLTKQGPAEKVTFSDMVVKINRKGKEQTRCILVTDKALYNLKANNFSKCQRRIALEKIVSVTLSAVSEEFVLHVPEEYDYHFKSAQRERLLSSLRAASAFTTLSLTQVSLVTLVINQKTAAKMTQAQRLKRKQELEAIGKAAVETKAPVSLSPVNVTHDFEFITVLGRGKFAKVMQVLFYGTKVAS